MTDRFSEAIESNQHVEFGGCSPDFEAGIF
jgi:hypothetical protein